MIEWVEDIGSLFTCEPRGYARSCGTCMDAITGTLGWPQLEKVEDLEGTVCIVGSTRDL